MSTSFQTRIPEQLDKQMKMLISEGWFSDMDEILSNALRRFLDSHKPNIMEHFIITHKTTSFGGGHGLKTMS